MAKGVGGGEEKIKWNAKPAEAIHKIPRREDMVALTDDLLERAKEMKNHKSRATAFNIALFARAEVARELEAQAKAFRHGAAGKVAPDDIATHLSIRAKEVTEG